jgi:hypothetical protein
MKAYRKKTSQTWWEKERNVTSDGKLTIGELLMEEKMEKIWQTVRTRNPEWSKMLEKTRKRRWKG